MRIRDIRRVGLLSPAIAAHADFYLESWGLRSLSEGGQVRYLRGTSTEHHILSLHPADRRGLHHLAFRLEGRKAVDAAAVELERRGITLVSRPEDLDEPGGGYGLRFLDPENRCIELSAVVAEQPSGRPAGKVSPRRLCHVGLNTARFEEIAAFYTDMLGFRVSDWIEDQLVFLRCGRRHHDIVFTRADYASVNHVAYAMDDVDDVMKGVSGLRARGHEPAWGPGRHGPGNNVFCYYRDPAGYVNEFSSDLAYIEDEATHTPAVWKRVPETLDLWGTAGTPGPGIRKAMAGDPDPGWTTEGVIED